MAQNEQLDSQRASANAQDFAKIVGFKNKKNLLYVLYGLDKKYTRFTITKKSGGSRTIQAPDKRLKRPQRQLSNFLYEIIRQAADGTADDFRKGSLDSRQICSRKNTVAYGFQKSYFASGESGQNKKQVKHIFNIYAHAKNHKNKRWVFNFDIQDFFATINFGRVRGFFKKNKNFKLNKVATLVAQLACYDNQLPQGSPCSPVISNLVASYLDDMLFSLAKKYKLTYSRYADDITFSTNRLRFPAPVACQIENSNKYKAGPRLQKTISKCGFKINPSKTRMQCRSSRQTVTGLIVNQKVNIKNEYYKACRAMCHSLFTKGEFYVENKKIQLGDDKKSLHEGLKVLEGMLNYIFYIKIISPLSQASRFSHLVELLRVKKQPKRRVYAAIKHRRPIENVSDSNVVNKIQRREGAGKLLYDFLIFKFLVSPLRATVVCEGKTDVAYLKSALKILYKANEENKKINVLNNFSHQMLGIGSGSGELRDFIAAYETHIVKYWRTKYLCSFCQNKQGKSTSKSKLKSTSASDKKSTSALYYKNRSSGCRACCCPKPEHPVIVLMDNDDGLKDTLNMMETKGYIRTFETPSQFIKCDDPFFYITHNLYLVKTPAKKALCGRKADDGSAQDELGYNAASKIEDCFDPTWLVDMRITHDDKNHKTSKTTDSHTQFKIWLADHVTKNCNEKDEGNNNHINFEGFRPLLKRFEAVSEHYNNKIRAQT